MVDEAEIWEEQSLAGGDSLLQVTVVGTQTEVGSSASVASNAKIVNREDEDVTACYTITYKNGTVTVALGKDVIGVSDCSKVYDGMPVNNPEVTRSGTGALTYEYYVNTGTIETPVYVKLDEAPINTGNYFVKVLEAAEGYYGAAESSYTPFVICKRELEIVALDDEKTYDGTPLNKNQYEVTNPNDLATGDSLLSVAVLGSQTDAGSCANVASEAVIKNAALSDVTENYLITYVDGTITVHKANDVITITSNLNKTYDGSMIQNPSVSRKSNGILSYEYYQKKSTNGEEVYEKLNSAPANAGTYYVRAFEGEGTNYLAAVSEYKEFTIQKAAQIITAEDKTVNYTGEPQAIVATCDGDGVLSYEGNNQVAQGTYKVIITASETNNYHLAKKEVNLTIISPIITEQETPKEQQFTIVSPQYADSTDGEIKGTNDSMEYSLNNGVRWVTCPKSLSSELCKSFYSILFFSVAL